MRYSKKGKAGVLCMIDGCSVPEYSQGLCCIHYIRRLTYGDPLTVKKPYRNGPDSFWAKVIKTDGCWTWTGSKTKGYGRFSVSGKNVPAHRYAYELTKGNIPEGMTLDHLCRNRSCVNPDHLEPVTSRVNTLRGIGLPATNAKKTYCKYGHEFTQENTYIVPSTGSRVCRVCQASRARDRWERTKLNRISIKPEGAGKGEE